MNQKKYKIIAIMGESGTGKDTIEKLAVQRFPFLSPIVSCTSRPPREGEIDGVDYHFIRGLNPSDFVEFTSFIGNFYGTRQEDLSEDKVNIGVFNPTGIRTLQRNPQISLKVIRLWTFDKTRMLRQLNREENPNVDEIVRRYQTDEEDFHDLSDIDFILRENNSKEHIETIMSTIKELAESF